MFVVGGDSALHHKWWDGTAWWPSATGGAAGAAGATPAQPVPSLVTAAT